MKKKNKIFWERLPHPELLNVFRCRFTDLTENLKKRFYAFYHDHNHDQPEHSTFVFSPDHLYCNYCLSGGGILTAPNGAKHSIKAGSFFCIVPKKDEGVWSFSFDRSESHVECSVGININLLKPLIYCGLLNKEPVVKNISLDEKKLAPFFKALTSMSNSMIPSGEILLQILNWINLFKQQPEETQGKKEDRLARIRSRLIEHLNITPCFKVIAAEFGMSYQSLRRSFQEAHKCSPNKWFQKQRITVACEALAQGEKVQEVAEKLGYSDAFHFSRQFKKHIGKAPKVFQTELKKAQFYNNK